MSARCHSCEVPEGKPHVSGCPYIEYLDESETAEACVACDGPLTLLGSLGSTAHYRCRNCGIESYRRLQ